MTRLHIYRDKKREWRWTLIASNGKKLANSGEGYKRASTMVRTVKRIFPWWQG